jgi:hypothetical protein
MMATADDAYGAANYLESLGDVECAHERPWYDPNPNYTTMVQGGTVQVNIYFTDRDPQVERAAFSW